MSLVNRTRKEANDHRNQAHVLMQQVVNLSTILQSPEYINCTTIDRNHINGMASNLGKDFNQFTAELNNLDQQLGNFNSRQLSPMDHSDLLSLDQQYIIWCERYSQMITPAVCALVEYIQSHFGVVNNG